jgi:hypothetical protein
MGSCSLTMLLIVSQVLSVTVEWYTAGRRSFSFYRPFYAIGSELLPFHDKVSARESNLPENSLNSPIQQGF